MKVVICVVLAAIVGLSLADTKTHSRGCIYIMGRCAQECEEGTHAYAVGCDQIIPEASCDEPNPVKEEGIICDYSDCYCDPPTVRNKESKKCVLLEDCPKKN